jgi:hypothetical protein
MKSEIRRQESDVRSQLFFDSCFLSSVFCLLYSDVLLNNYQTAHSTKNNSPSHISVLITDFTFQKFKLNEESKIYNCSTIMLFKHHGVFLLMHENDFYAYGS